MKPIIKKVLYFAVSSLIVCCIFSQAYASNGTTYGISPNENIFIKLIPSDNVVKISVDGDFFSGTDVSYIFAALYSNEQMVTINVFSPNHTSSILSYNSERPPIIRLFYLDEYYVPVCESARYDLYSEAYSIEDDTFYYIYEYNRLTSEFNTSYNALCNELSSLQENKTEAENAVTKARLDLENLPNKKNGYLVDRRYYWIHQGNTYNDAMTLANRDWNRYYTKQQSELNSKIITNDALSSELSTQISSKQSEINTLTNSYNNSVAALRQQYPDAKNGIIGGTYKTDQLTG